MLSPYIGNMVVVSIGIGTGGNAGRKWTMSNETTTKERTQIGWGTLDDNARLYADVPGSNDRVWFEMKDLHETWKTFILAYGVKQYVSSALAKVSFTVDADMAANLANAKASGIETAITAAREEIRLAKAEWLKRNSADIRTALWKELQALKGEKTAKEKADRETKAQVELRVKSEMIEKMKAAFEAQGFDEDTIKILLANL